VPQPEIVQLHERDYLRVLDADPALLAAIPTDRRETARQRLLAPTTFVESGPWKGDELSDPNSLGLLVTEGLLTRNVQVAGTTSREILGTGDILRPWDDDTALNPLPSKTSWTVIESARFALLDERFRLLAGHWPELGTEILHRVLRRSRWLAVILAIANLRGVEDRVFLLLWHLAGNWGRVTAAGTLVPFGLTHELIADLVGARRPSVSTAIAELEREGRVERVRDGWLLRADPPESGG
jgi:CRP/FNR family transcriptional regulator, cyclic AMP receptor protein